MRTPSRLGRSPAPNSTTLVAAAIAGGLAASLAGCSSDSSTDTPAAPDTTAPAASSYVQDRTNDTTGQTVVVTFSEAVTQATAEVAGSYTFSGGVNVQTATQSMNGMSVSLVLDAPAIPGDNTIAIAAGIEDAAGNASVEVTATAITSTDTTAPAAASVAGLTISGPSNDQIVAVFNDSMIQAEAETVANWSLESPLGTPFDATGATIAYDTATMTATITLGAGSADQNLQTFDAVHASFIGMRDLGGNTIAATTIGTTAVNGMVGGDAQPPVLLAAAPGAGNTLELTFSESVSSVETVDLKSVSLTNGTDIVLTDANDPGMAATGTFELTGTVVDGDSITISDGTTPVTFEFDFGASGTISLSGLPSDMDTVVIEDATALSVEFEFDDGGGAAGAGTAVLLGVDAPATIVNLLAAIDASALAMTAAAGSTANDIDLRNASGGAAGNVTITGTDGAGVQTLTGMAGGGVGGGNVAVIIDTTTSTMVTVLRAAIDANGFNITTSNGGTATDFIVTNDAPGTAGNVTILESDAGGVIDFTGMAGGTGIGLVTYEPTVSTAVGSDITATVTFAIAPEAADSLRLYGVTDLAGNQMLPETAATVVAASVTEPSLSGINLAGVTVEGEGNDSFSFVFTDPVHPDGAMDAANYTLTNGALVDLTNASFSYNIALGQVDVSFPGASNVNLQSAGSIVLTADNLRSLQGVTISAPDTETGAITGDTTAPTIGVSDARLDPAASSSVFVIFNEAVSTTGGADAANYAIVGNTTSGAVLVTPRVARVTFANTVTVADTIDIAVAAATDLAGNVAGGVAMIAVGAADAAVPTVTTVTATNGNASGRDTIVIEYSEPVSMALSEAMANYTVTAGGTAVDLTAATFWSSSTNDSVTIQLPESLALQTGDTVSVTPANVTDVAGNAIVSAATTATVAGDSSAPATVDAFQNIKEDITNMTTEFVFAEAMDATITSTLGNWSGSAGQSATAVTMTNDRSFRVTFDAAIGAAETIDILTPTDRAGNAGGTITVNPTE